MVGGCNLKLDLHLHTNASDGTDSPTDVVRSAAQVVELLSITDHDTLSGIDEALMAGELYGVKVIPGVEISAGGENEIHILGYGIIPGGAIEMALERMRGERTNRMLCMITKVQNLGMDITIDEVTSYAKGPLGRAHLARAMVDKSFVANLKEAFEKYLAPGKPGFVPREKLDACEVIALIRRNGGVPVIAHPALINLDSYWLENRIRDWKQAGLMGLEVYHSSHTQQMARVLYRLTLKLGLLVTGGSDYHGNIKSHVNIGDGMQWWYSRDADAKAFLSAIDNNNGFKQKNNASNS